MPTFTPLTTWIIEQARLNPDPTDADVLRIKLDACRRFGATRDQVQYSIKNARKNGRIPGRWGYNIGGGRSHGMQDQNAAPSIVDEKINYTMDTENVNAGLQGFRKLYDKGLTIPSKIQTGIDTFLKRNGWMYDDDFRRACGVKSTDWRRFTREFEHLQLRVDGGVLVWGHPSIIEQMREVALA